MITQKYLHALNLKRAMNAQFLSDLVINHISQLSFNNIGALLHGEISLDLEKITDKLLEQGLGGYCFEHNKLVHHVLNDLGFSTKLVLAKVTYNKTHEVPRTHRITLVRLHNKTWLVDAGFGPNNPQGAVEIVADTVQKLGNESFKFCLTERQTWQLNVEKPEGWFSLYEFDLADYQEQDCTPANFYASTHSSSGFVNNLVISKRLPQQTIVIRNQTFSTIKDGIKAERLINDSTELQTLIKAHFGIELSKRQCEGFVARFFEQPEVSNA